MLLEGPDIRTLLAQVREEHGPDARIVHAERVRSGGVGGFFAKQRFEVTVEIDGDASGSATTSDQLAQQFSTGSGDSFTPSARPTPRPAAAPSLDRIEPIEAPVSATSLRPVGSVARGEAALAAKPLPWAQPRPEVGGAPVDALVAAMDRADGAETGDRRGPSLVPSALTDPFTPGRLPVEPVLPILDEASRAAGIDPRPLTPVGPLTVAAAEPTPLGDLVGWLATQQAALADAVTARTPAAAPAPAQTSTPAAPAAPTVDPAVLAGIVARAGLLADAPVAETPAAPAAPSTPIADAVQRERTIATVTPLPGVAATATRPAAPRAPRRPGDVLVLVGDAGPAFETAQALAASLRVPADRVRVVSHAPVAGLAEEQRIVDVLEARLAGAQLAMERTPGIVVVDAPLGLVADAHGCDWVDDVVAALDPTAVWAVVDATRRHDDLVRWLGVLPELEALAVHGVAVTSDPEAVHHLGVPVALVDGRAVPDPTHTPTPEPTARRRTS